MATELTSSTPDPGPKPADAWAIGPGVEVELTAPLVAADASTLQAYRDRGNNRPPGSVNGRDYFGASIGSRARVVARDGDALRIVILTGKREGRQGYVSVESVRIPQTEAESSADVVGGPDLLARRQVYIALGIAGDEAKAEAESRYPLGAMPTEPGELRGYLDERAASHEGAKAGKREEILARYQIDGDQLDEIEAEGDRERWPAWDGLEDEQGPIPTFGPARTDPGGRLVVDRQEDEARREASIRALKAVARITDETDTDEVWRRMEGTFGGAS